MEQLVDSDGNRMTFLLFFYLCLKVIFVWDHITHNVKNNGKKRHGREAGSLKLVKYVSRIL